MKFWMSSALLLTSMLTACGTTAAPSHPPWTVQITGTSGIVLQGGCETYTTYGGTNPTINITLPWSHSYGAQDVAVNCYFQNQASYGQGAITIRYDGQVISRGTMTGSYGILSAYAQQP